MPSSEQLSVAFYDQLGAEGLAARTAPSWDEQILTRLREWLIPGQQILDVGCGYGRIAIPLARSGFDVTGLDLSDRLLQAARDRAESLCAVVGWIHANMCCMPLPDKAFDIALCLWSAFHELLEEDEQVRAAVEMYRVLRPGGWCLVEGPLFHPATAEEIALGRRSGLGNRVSMDIVCGLSNPHFCHDPGSFGQLMEQAGIEYFKIYEEIWAGRPRQFLRFMKH
jgi:SAM-dependent methyltransferase